MLKQDKENMLFKDGVNKKYYFYNINHYQSCAECLEPFNQSTQIPNLLQCGHVCCKQCLLSNKPCVCCGNIAKRKKVVKLLNYKGLFEEVKTVSTVSTEKELLYNFHIRIMKDNVSIAKAISVNNKKASTTFAQLLAEISKYVQLQRKNGFALSFANRLLYYQQVKGKPISNYLTIIKSNQTNDANQISILDRFRGGAQLPIDVIE